MDTTPDDKPNLIRLTDAMANYGLSRSTFNRAVIRGDLTRHKAGRITFFDEAEITRWITTPADAA